SRSSRRSCEVCGPSAVPYELTGFGGGKQRLLIVDLHVEHFVQRAVQRAIQRGFGLAHREGRHTRPLLRQLRRLGHQRIASHYAIEQAQLRRLRRERYSAALALRTARGAILDHCFASFVASAISASPATTRSNRPSCAASAAGTMRALHTSSSAFETLVRRGRK